MNFITGIGNDLIWIGAVILGGLMAFFTFRNHYISKGEDRAHNRANDLTLRRILKAKEQEQQFGGVRSEKICLNDNDSDADFVWNKDAISQQ